MERDKGIRMVALDLDGTALGPDRHFSPRTREVFRRCMDRGIHIVISTGRVWHSLPEEMFSIEGLEYVITSNGAAVTEIATGEKIYENPISSASIDGVLEVIRPWYGQPGFSVDAFTEGKAYIEERDYMDIRDNGSDYRDVEYVLSTRNPVKDLPAFIERHRDRMENISLIFRHPEEQEQMREKLEQIRDITLVSSFANNFEIGGTTTSKADALRMLMERLELAPSALMACGDSLNDLAMIRMAEIGVAMGNAPASVQQEADFVTTTNDRDGVAEAVEKFVLIQP